MSSRPQEFCLGCCSPLLGMSTVQVRQPELEIKAPFSGENLYGKQNQGALCKLIRPITKPSLIKVPLKHLAHDYSHARQGVALKREKINATLLNEVSLLKRDWDSETPSRNCQIWSSKNVFCNFHAKSTGKVSRHPLLGPQQR